MSHSDREGVCSDLYSDLRSDLYSDLSRKEVTIGKAHKHWDERPISDLRRYIAKIIKKTTRTTREQLKKVSLANLLNCFLYHFGRFAKIPKLNCPKLSRLSLYIKIMLLALKIMLLEIEVMLLAAEVMLLHAEVMLLQTEAQALVREQDTYIIIR